MRTTDERMAELTRRIEKKDQNQARRRSRWLVMGSLAASLVLIVGLSFMMPGMVNRLSGRQYDYVGPAASVFTENGVLGFIIIGILAFALGAGVTVFCYKLRNRNENGEGEAKKNDRNHG